VPETEEHTLVYLIDGIQFYLYIFYGYNTNHFFSCLINPFNWPLRVFVSVGFFYTVLSVYGIFASVLVISNRVLFISIYLFY